MSNVTANETLCKQPSESRLYGMDFSSLLATGETLNSPVVTHETTNGGVGAELDVEATPSIDGPIVTVWISGGLDGVRYRIEFLVETSTGQILESDGILVVKDK